MMVSPTSASLIIIALSSSGRTSTASTSSITRASTTAGLFDSCVTSEVNSPRWV
ncbi:hypothetical protein D3C85_1385870 [compost metagenome]